MDDRQAQRLPTFEGAIGLAGAQILALVVCACACAVIGIAYLDAVGTDGYDIDIPFAGAMAVALSGVGLGLCVATVGRFQFLWDDRRERLVIVVGLAQVLVSAIAAILSGLVISEWRMDLLMPMQTVVAWWGHGFVIGGGVQVALALTGLVLFGMAKGLPDFIDD